MKRRPQIATLFPYTTLFRSLRLRRPGARCLPAGPERASLANFGARAAPLHEVARSRLREHVGDRKSTRLNSSHVRTSYAVFCLKKTKVRNALFTKSES